jgi:hypothetical protein
MDPEMKFIVGLGVIGIAVLGLAYTSSGLIPLASPADQAGFLQGYWHGVSLMFNYVASLFSDAYVIYETPNSGGWYDTGYILGLFSFFGIIGSSSEQ